MRHLAPKIIKNNYICSMNWTLLPICAALIAMSCSGDNKLDADAIENNETTAENPIPSGPLGTPDFGTDTTFQFGKIMDGETVSHEFEFTNTGKGDLVVNNVKASCGCTTPDWTKEPIKPGEKGMIKAVFNSAGKGTPEAVPVTKAVTVDFNSSTVPVVVLQFTANVKSK
jgi:hypothetical protein